MGSFLGKNQHDFCRGIINKSGFVFNKRAPITTKKDAPNRTSLKVYTKLGLTNESNRSFMSVAYLRPRLTWSSEMLML